MLSPEERKKRTDNKCRHFTGTANKVCKNKIEYASHGEDFPCFGESNVICCGYYPLTAEELATKEKEHERHMDLMRRGLSSCCEAPFDTSQVITSGRFKNHGPRFCSKCKRVCFMV